MSEPALRQLDRDLPHLDMYAPALRARQLARRLGVSERQPSKAHTEKGSDAKALIDAARKMMADATADRRAAAETLADARAMAATIIAEAEASARIVVNIGPALPSVAAVQKAVAERYGISLSTLLGPGLSKDVVVARYEAIRQAHAVRPELSPASLGRLFRRDRTIVSRALKGKGPQA